MAESQEHLGPPKRKVRATSTWRQVSCYPARVPVPNASHLLRLLAVIASLCSFGVSPARAQLPPGVVIHWKTSSECTRPLDLEWQITRLLAPKIELPGPVAFSVRVDARNRGAYALALAVHGVERDLERNVVLASCGEVQDAVALLVAITIDPSAEQRAKFVRAAPEPPPQRLEPLRQPQVRAPREPLLPPARALLRAGLLGDLHALPDASFGPALGLELGLGPLRIALGGAYLLPRSAQTAVPGIEGRVDLGVGMLALAYLPELGRVALGPSLAFEVGYMRAQGVGATDGRSVGTPWLAVLPGGRFDVALHPRVRLRLELLAGLPLRRPKLALRGESVFYETRRLTARIELGLLIPLGSRG